MREVIIDTETTGLEVAEGHRLVSIGCVEVLDGRPTGAEQEWLINPQRDVPEEASRVHGLTLEALSDKPIFSEIADDVIAFIRDAQLVMHNAPFDMSFLNSELKSCGLSTLAANPVVDTLVLARRMFPGEPANLDALCRRYDVSLQERQLHHGALLDARLLARVYCLMAFGNQVELGLAIDRHKNRSLSQATPQEQRNFKLLEPNPQEKAAHTELVKKLHQPLWENNDA